MLPVTMGHVGVDPPESRPRALTFSRIHADHVSRKSPPHAHGFDRAPAASAGCADAGIGPFPRINDATPLRGVIHQGIAILRADGAEAAAGAWGGGAGQFRIDIVSGTICRIRLVSLRWAVYSSRDSSVCSPSLIQ